MTAKTAKTAKTAMLAVLAPALVVFALAGCHQKPDAPAAPPLPVVRVQVRVVESKPRPMTEEVVGTVASRLHAVIEAKVSGRLEKMLVSPGQSVKKGELLAQLDAAEIRARLEQSQALRDQYTSDAERLGRLLTNNTISPQEFQAVESRRRVAVAAVAEAETMLGYTSINAPFDGVVTRKLADVGDLAAPGRPLLELDDPTSLRLEADVPEALLGRVQLGATLPVRVSGATTNLNGIISEIAPVADPGSRTFRVKLDLPQTAGLRAGQFGHVAIPLGENAALRVPSAAVIMRGQMEIVFVVSNQRAQLRLVKTGKRIGDEVELVSGVSAGEQVIMTNPGDLMDGQPVEVRP